MEEILLVWSSTKTGMSSLVWHNLYYVLCCNKIDAQFLLLNLVGIPFAKSTCLNVMMNRLELKWTNSVHMHEIGSMNQKQIHFGQLNSYRQVIFS